MGFKGNTLKQRNAYNPCTTKKKKIGVENQIVLIKIYSILLRIGSFTFWKLSVPIFITALAKEHHWLIVWTGEGWEGTWGPLVGDPGDLRTLGRISRDLGTLGWMLRGGDGQCFSLCRSLSPLGIQLRGCFDCSSHTLAYNIKSIVIW